MKFGIWCRRHLWICIIFVLVVYCAGNVLWSYKGLTVTRYEYRSAKVTETVRLVLISDLHGNTLGEGNSGLVEAIREQEPDLILMAGDFLEAEATGDGSEAGAGATEADDETADAAGVADEELARVVALVSELDAMAPVYYSLGNHEVGYMEQRGELPSGGADAAQNGQTQDAADGAVLEVLTSGDGLISRLEAAGAVVLEEEYVDIEVRGQKIRLGGMYAYAFATDGYDSTNSETMDPEVYAFLTEFQETEALKVMMAHRPESFVLGEASVTWDIDLVASGHVHGGQVVLPVLGGLWACEQGYWPEYETGLHEKDRIHIVITNGLGSGGQVLPRFNNPPEVVVVDVSN